MPSARKVDPKIRHFISGLIFITALYLLYLVFYNRTDRVAWLDQTWLNNNGRDLIPNGLSLATLLAPFLAFLIGVLTHLLDGWKKGGGIKNVFNEEIKEGQRYNLRTEVVSATMTKQSVLAAIASILIFIIQDKSPDRIQTITTITDFQGLVRLLATMGFLATILTLLISMLCYDYASRFNWKDMHRGRLVRKALMLDIFSWYTLLFSFILSIALFSASISVAACIACGILLRWYYFFRLKEKSSTTMPICGVFEVVIPVKSLSQSEAFYINILNLEVCLRDNGRRWVSLRTRGHEGMVVLQEDIGEWPKQYLALTVDEDDLEDAAQKLREKNIHCKGPFTYKWIPSKSVHLTDPDGHFLELRAITNNA